MAKGREDGLRRLLSGALPFPDSGRVFLADADLPFLEEEIAAALGHDRLVIVDRRFGRAAPRPPFQLRHGFRAEAGPGDMVVLPAGRDRLKLFHDLRFYSNAVGATGLIALYGTRKVGMLPAEALLRDHCREIEARQRGGARLLVVAPRDDAAAWELPSPPDSYFAEARGQRVEVCARPGLFSWDSLDEASALMLERSKPREGDRLLDLGCGNGVVAAILLKEGLVASATLTDEDALAVEAASRTLELGELDGEVVASDAGEGLPAKSFDLVLCNPPYHSGSMQVRGPGRRMIEQAARVLASKGRLYLVAPVFHDHGPELERLFRSHDVVAETPSIRIWRATRPRRQPRPR